MYKNTYGSRIFCILYLDYLTKIIKENRSKYTGISSKNNGFNHCRRKFKVFDPIFLKIKTIDFFKKIIGIDGP